MEGILINHIKPADEKSSKGKTIEWCKGIEGKQVSIFYRNKGISFAAHFHKGIDPSKNPERFFIISGKIKLSAKNHKGEIFETEINEGNEILISPNIFHKIDAITDVVFLEYRQTIFDRQQSDTYNEEEF